MMGQRERCASDVLCVYLHALWDVVGSEEPR